MTFLEKYSSELHDETTLADGSPAFCPCYYHYEEWWDCGKEKKMTCGKCWRREMPQQKERNELDALSIRKSVLLEYYDLADVNGDKERCEMFKREIDEVQVAIDKIKQMY